MLCCGSFLPCSSLFSSLCCGPVLFAVVLFEGGCGPQAAVDAAAVAAVVLF